MQAEKEILFVEFSLYIVTNKSDATAPLRDSILKGKVGQFEVANYFDVLEGLFFRFFIFSVFILPSGGIIFFT